MRTIAERMKKVAEIVTRMPGSSSRRHSSSNSWTTWRRLEIGLLVVGVLLVGFYATAGLERYFSAQTALKQFQSDAMRTPAALPPVEDPASAEPEPGTRAGNQPPTSAIKPSPQRRAPLGVLEVPNIGLLAPLLEGTDALTLNRGVGRIAGTARPGEAGNLGIAGHRDSFFRGLKDIKPGDPIVLKTAAGTDTYVVDRSRIVSPRDVSVLRAEAAPSLTLITCYPFYYVGKAPQRFVVTAYLVNHAAAGPTTLHLRPSPQAINPTLE
jgi:sortase A